MVDAAAPSSAPTASSTRDLVTADGTPLKVALARATRLSKLRAFLLVAPLLLFILVSFIFPIVQMLWRSIDNPEVTDAIPRTAALLEDWNGEDLPSEQVYAALIEEISADGMRQEIGRMGARLNYEDGGFRSLINKTQRGAGEISESPIQYAMIGFDEAWEKQDTWAELDALAESPGFAAAFPATAEKLRAWETGNSPFAEKTPGADVYETLFEELSGSGNSTDIAQVVSLLGGTDNPIADLIQRTAANAAEIKDRPLRFALGGVDKDWNDTATWKVIKAVSPPVTMSYYLNALDRTYDANGNIVMQPEWKQIYVDLFLKTIYVSLGVTLCCIVLAYPIAHLLAILPAKHSNLLLILVLLPFWTSLLVRTTSWIVLLQSQGVVNDVLFFLGIVTDESRLQLIYNMTGTVIAMTHILLPFMVLPLYSVMKTISPSYLRAARSLGANPLVAFVRVYVPQTVPGIGAGSILVFILAIGYYITPALVGGQDGQLISNFIAYHMQRSLNWGMAAALGTVLLAGVLAMYWLYDRLVGIDNMKLG
ncbi:MAG: ABC transporter permease subunit [Alphaproteobacteria bacterium]|nr:ABC transporter permease subunit [Alphaproteobacteria bacterium]